MIRKKLQTRFIPVMDITFLLATAIFVLSAWGYQFDDAYIFYTYAENIASGNGYVFNIGESVNATTSVLYTLSLAVITWLARLFGITHITPYIGFTITILGIWIAGIIGMRLFYRHQLKIAALAFPFILLMCLPFLIINAVGMETYLTIALIMAAIYAYDTGKYNLMGILCGLATLSRPDAIILPAVIFIHYLITKRRVPPLMPLALFAVVLIPWFIFAQMTFGSILPSSLSAKINQTSTGFFGGGAIFATHFIWSFSFRYGIATAAGILVSFAILFRSRKSIQWQGFMWIIFFWSILLFTAYCIMNPPGYIWYYTPYIILIAGLLSLTLEIILRQETMIARVLEFAVPMFVVVLFIINIMVNLNGEEIRYENYREVAFWLNENAPQNASVGANEIGILAYYYENGAVIDGLGLATEGVAEHLAQGDYTWYVHEYEPDYLMFRYPQLRIFEDMVEEDWFIEQYELAEIITTPGRQMAIYQRR